MESRRAEKKRFSAHGTPDMEETRASTPFGQITHTGFPLHTGLPPFGDYHLIGPGNT